MTELKSYGRTKSPCYGCQDRAAGCHATCEKYKEFKSVHEEEVATIKANKKKYKETYPMYRTDKEFAKAGTMNDHMPFKQTKK